MTAGGLSRDSSSLAPVALGERECKFVDTVVPVAADVDAEAAAVDTVADTELPISLAADIAAAAAQGLLWQRNTGQPAPEKHGQTRGSRTYPCHHPFPAAAANSAVAVNSAAVAMECDQRIQKLTCRGTRSERGRTMVEFVVKEVAAAAVAGKQEQHSQVYRCSLCTPTLSQREEDLEVR